MALALLALSLVPDIRLPRAVRSEVAIAVPVLFAVWALAGFYGSLGPALAAIVLHSSSVVYGGLSLFILAGSPQDRSSYSTAPRPDPSSTWASQRSSRASRRHWWRRRRTRRWACSPARPSPGVGFGSGFQGSIRLVPLVGEQDRAGVLSALYVVVYLGLGVPAVIGGVLVKAPKWRGSAADPIRAARMWLSASPEPKTVQSRP